MRTFNLASICLMAGNDDDSELALNGDVKDDVDEKAELESKLPNLNFVYNNVVICVCLSNLLTSRDFRLEFPLSIFN